MESEDIRMIYSMGREAFRRGEYSKAIELLEQFAESNPGFADVFNMLGQAYHANSKFDEAVAAFEKALVANPKYTEAGLNLAVTLFDLGRYDQAAEIQERIQKEARTSGDNLDGFARKKLANMHAEIAGVYHAVGLLESAMEEYKKALEMAPDFPDVRTKLAEAYRDDGRTADAIGELKKVKETNPNYMPARVSLGIIYYTMERYNEAQAEWDHVLQIDPGHATVRTYLRMVNKKK